MTYAVEPISQTMTVSDVTLGASAQAYAQSSLMENEDEYFYTRCRRAVLRLSEQLVKAAAERNDFAPFLLEAMHNAMSELLQHGDESALILLEQWLDEENADQA